ncbi:RIP metalloprotease RseP [Salinimicrobium terrae]|uniref:RIP metalloprotease RseP n=1 Tax=Salinimicrobium terrae TaxID=470866 RepID=UPI000491711D|nr:RIP metalloprotease RseP [Salinimicrobium terrae]
MDPFFIKALQLILSLSILIVLHELGHYLPAKMFGIKVEKFFLFFDVKFALFKKKIGDTVYGIGWLPLGGYVKIAGMIDESMDKEQMAQAPKPWEFRSKPAWQRLIVMIGGVTVNIVLGFFIYMMVVFTWGSPYIAPEDMPNGFAVDDTFKEYGFQDGDKVLAVNGEELKNSIDINKYLFLRDVNNITVEHQDGQRETISVPEEIGSQMFEQGVMQPFVPMTIPILDSVVAGSPADLAGLKKGDRIISINDIEIGYWHQLTRQVEASKDQELRLVYSREGEFESVELDEVNAEILENHLQTVSLTPNEEGNLGVYVFPQSSIKVSREHFSFAESIEKGFDLAYWTLHDYVAQFKYVFTKKGATQVGGFGAIGGLFPDAWNWQAFWMTTAFISIILAFMNILPIPALDGGHVVFLLYEMVTGRAPNEKFMEYAQLVGFVILIALVLFANGNDIYRWLFE